MFGWVLTAIVGAAIGYFVFGRSDKERAVIYALIGAVAMVLGRFVLWLLNILVFGALFAALGVIGVIVRIVLSLALGCLCLGRHLAHQSLAAQLKKHSLRRTYEAIVCGNVKADAVNRLLNNPGQRQKMAEQGKRHAALFSEERQAQQLMDLYNSLLSDKK